MTVQETRTVHRPYRSGTPRRLDAYLEQVADNYAPLANPFEYYTWLIDELASLRDIDFAPLSLGTSNPSRTARRIFLRHDVDADPLTALRAARHLARVGLPGSFYLLHTAPYYGEFIEGVFVRRPELVEWIESFVVAGCEIGLHNDAWGAFVEHGVDCVDLIRTELDWLRRHGANVQGTVAHNSAPVHGAENYEIFKGHVLWTRDVYAPDGRPLPLGSIDPIEVGLGYEGTYGRPRVEVDPAAAAAFVATESSDVRDEKWMRAYLTDNPICDWAVDAQFWLVGPDQWIAGGRKRRRTFFKFGIDARRVIKMIGAMPGNARVVLVIHPEYVRL